MERIWKTYHHQATIHGDLAKLSDCNLTRAKSKSNWHIPQMSTQIRQTYGTAWTLHSSFT
jgi:hypothetical protein